MTMPNQPTVEQIRQAEIRAHQLRAEYIRDAFSRLSARISRMIRPVRTIRHA